MNKFLMHKFLREHKFPFSWVKWSYANYVGRFEELPNWFSKWPPHFAIPLATNEGCNFSTFATTLVIVCLFYFSHPGKYKVESYYGFFGNSFLVI